MAGQEFEKMGIDEVIIYLKTDREKGISSEEAKIRLEKYGYNEVTDIKEKNSNSDKHVTGNILDLELMKKNYKRN